MQRNGKSDGGGGGDKPSEKIQKKKIFFELNKNVDPSPPSSYGQRDSPKGFPHPMPLDALGANLSCRGSPCANRPGRRAGRQVTFHVSPRPGQTPTSRPALGNYRPSPFPTGTPSFPHTVPRKWGSGSPNLSSALLMQCLLSLPLSLRHTHTHTQTVEMNLPKESPQNCAKAKGQNSAQMKGNLLCRLCISTVSLGNACIRQWKKKIPKPIPPARRRRTPGLVPRQRRSAPAARAEAGCPGSGLRRREKEPGRSHVPLR